MNISWKIIRAMEHCPYKAWLLTREPNQQSIQQEPNCKGNEAQLTLGASSIDPDDKLALTAWCNEQKEQSIETCKIIYGIQAPDKKNALPLQATSFRISRYNKQAQKLLIRLNDTVGKSEPPSFYRNKHCPDCQFQSSCHEKLKERNCISLLGGISPKILAKYHKKGLFSITQLAFTFRPRRRRGRPQPSGSYPWN